MSQNRLLNLNKIQAWRHISQTAWHNVNTISTPTLTSTIDATPLTKQPPLSTALPYSSRLYYHVINTARHTSPALLSLFTTLLHFSPVHASSPLH
jgi:hypothetical protein